MVRTEILLVVEDLLLVYYTIHLNDCQVVFEKNIFDRKKHQKPTYRHNLKKG